MARFGEIGKQYFDDAGDPLISGKLYFYESGTLTPKDTFADVNLTIPNTNPVVLTASGRQPNVFFTGLAKVILTSSDSVQIEVRDPDGSDAANNLSAYNPLTTYVRWAIVVASNNRFYRLIVASSQGNDPITSTTLWEELEFVGIYNPNIDYAVNATVKYSDGRFYKSLVTPNIGNPPPSSPASWGSPIVTNVVEDLTPQLGGDLDAQSNKITNIAIGSVSGDVVPLSQIHATALYF